MRDGRGREGIKRIGSFRPAAAGTRVPRILLVSPTLLHAGSDPRTIRCRRLIADLPRHGFEVDVVAWWGGEGEPPGLGCETLHAVRSDSPYADGAHGPDGLGAWIDAAERAVLQQAGERRPDLVLAVALPLASLVAGARVAEALDVPLVADLGDPWDPEDAGGRDLRDATLGRAAALITTTDALAATLADALPARAPVLIAPNGGTHLRPDRAGDGGPPLFVQLGTLTTARIDPRPAYEALGALAAEGAISFRSHGGAWLDGSESLPHPHRPPLGHAESLELLRGAGAALVLGNVNREQLPSKAFELACTDVWALCVSELENDPATAVLRASGHAVEAANRPASIRAAALEIVRRLERGERPEPDSSHSWERRIDAIAELVADLAPARA